MIVVEVAIASSVVESLDVVVSGDVGSGALDESWLLVPVGPLVGGPLALLVAPPDAVVVVVVVSAGSGPHARPPVRQVSRTGLQMRGVEPAVSSAPRTCRCWRRCSGPRTRSWRASRCARSLTNTRWSPQDRDEISRRPGDRAAAHHGPGALPSPAPGQASEPLAREPPRRREPTWAFRLRPRPRGPQGAVDPPARAPSPAPPSTLRTRRPAASARS